MASERPRENIISQLGIYVCMLMCVQELRLVVGVALKDYGFMSDIFCKNTVTSSMSEPIRKNLTNPFVHTNLSLDGTYSSLST